MLVRYCSFTTRPAAVMAIASGRARATDVPPPFTASYVSTERGSAVARAAARSVVAVGLAILALLLVRRGAPAGSYYADGDRASGVFGPVVSSDAVICPFISTDGKNRAASWAKRIS